MFRKFFVNILIILFYFSKRSFGSTRSIHDRKKLSRSAEELETGESLNENKENQQNEEIPQKKKANTLVIQPVSEIKLNNRFRSFRSKKDSLIENINNLKTFMNKRESTGSPDIIIKEEPGEEKSNFQAEVEEKVIFFYGLMKFLKNLKFLIYLYILFKKIRWHIGKKESEALRNQ